MFVSSAPFVKKSRSLDTIETGDSTCPSKGARRRPFILLQMYAQTRIPTTSKCSACIIPTSQDVMKRELIDIRPGEASSGCLRRGLAPATMTLLFHLTYENKQ